MMLERLAHVWHSDRQSRSELQHSMYVIVDGPQIRPRQPIALPPRPVDVASSQ